MTNFLLLTVDDMNYNSNAFLGNSDVPLMPRIDALRDESVLFTESHVTIAVCQPSRSVLLTGRYPHQNGARGFERIDESVTTLTELLHKHGWYNGIIGKQNHVAPKEKFFWDSYVQTYCEEGGYGRVPEIYYKETRAVCRAAKEAGKPLFLMANAHDPHRPFAGSEDELTFFGGHIPYSHAYQPEEVRVPDFLPDLPDIRLELAQYLTSVHRADETVGRILDAMSDEGMADDCVVFFLSDNGMALPFCKANCYLNSTKSPFAVRWNGHFAPRVTEALAAGIDYTPTILEIAGIPAPDGVAGQSLLPLLSGKTDRQYDDVYTSFFKTARNQVTQRELHFPMRSVQNRRFAYIYNAWSNGETRYTSESMAGLSYRAMEQAAETDPAIRERVTLYRLRVREELYDTQADPGALKNLIGEPAYRETAAQLRGRMLTYMRETGDELLTNFENDILNGEA